MKQRLASAGVDASHGTWEVKSELHRGSRVYLNRSPYCRLCKPEGRSNSFISHITSFGGAKYE